MKNCRMILFVSMLVVAGNIYANDEELDGTLVGQWSFIEGDEACTNEVEIQKSQNCTLLIAKNEDLAEIDSTSFCNINKGYQKKVEYQQSPFKVVSTYEYATSNNGIMRNEFRKISRNAFSIIEESVHTSNEVKLENDTITVLAKTSFARLNHPILTTKLLCTYHRLP